VPVKSALHVLLKALSVARAVSGNHPIRRCERDRTEAIGLGQLRRAESREQTTVIEQIN
jgi:hypothetical protein